MKRNTSQNTENEAWKSTTGNVMLSWTTKDIFLYIPDYPVLCAVTSKRNELLMSTKSDLTVTGGHVW